MKLEDQVTNLELSKRLAELGIEQDSLFYWSICHECEKEYPEGSVHWELDCGKKYGENVSAYTSAELGEMLPLWFDSGKREEKDYICRFYDKHKNITHSSFGETDCDSRARMLIHLLQNDLIKVEDVNK